MTTNGLLSIGEVARLSGLRASALRYYERRGILPPAARSGGRRVYPVEVLVGLRVLKAAQRAGLSLAEIGELLQAGESSTAGERLRAAAERKLPEVERSIERARAVRAWLEAARGCGCATFEECGLFGEALPASTP